jgi:hypothetical protein
MGFCHLDEIIHLGSRPKIGSRALCKRPDFPLDNDISATNAIENISKYVLPTIHFIQNIVQCDLLIYIEGFTGEYVGDRNTNFNSDL